jgi:hypothetical protein
VEVIARPVHEAGELDGVIAVQAREPNSGLTVMPDPSKVVLSAISLFAIR